MPRYQYTGDHPLILTGLIAGANATVTGREPGEGTLVAEPGDVIDTHDVYEHALLTELDAEEEAPADEAPKTPARRRSNPPTQNEE